MTSTTNRWKLGLFVVLANVAAIAVLSWLGLSRLDRPTITVVAYFNESVHGLSIGSQVEFRGVPIGRVSDIGVAEDKRHIEVKADLYRDRMEEIHLRAPDAPATFDPEAVPTGLRVQLVTSALTGIAFLQADYVATEDPMPPDYGFPVPVNTVHTVPSTFAQLEAGILGTLNSFPTMVDRVMRELDDLNLKEVSADTRTLLQSVTTKVEGLEELAVVREATEALRDSRDMMQRIDRLVDGWYSDEGPIKTLSADYRALAARLDAALVAADVPATAASIRGASDEVGGVANEAAVLTRDLRGELARLRGALEAVERLALMLERDPGALLHGRSTPQSPTQRGK